MNSIFKIKIFIFSIFMIFISNNVLYANTIVNLGKINNNFSEIGYDKDDIIVLSQSPNDLIIAVTIIAIPEKDVRAEIIKENPKKYKKFHFLSDVIALNVTSQTYASMEVTYFDKDVNEICSWKVNNLSELQWKKYDINSIYFCVALDIAKKSDKNLINYKIIN